MVWRRIRTRSFGRRSWRRASSRMLRLSWFDGRPVAEIDCTDSDANGDGALFLIDVVSNLFPYAVPVLHRKRLCLCLCLFDQPSRQFLLACVRAVESHPICRSSPVQSSPVQPSRPESSSLFAPPAHRPFLSHHHTSSLLPFLVPRSQKHPPRPPLSTATIPIHPHPMHGSKPTAPHAHTPQPQLQPPLTSLPFNFQPPQSEQASTTTHPRPPISPQDTTHTPSPLLPFPALLTRPLGAV